MDSCGRSSLRPTRRSFLARYRIPGLRRSHSGPTDTHQPYPWLHAILAAFASSLDFDRGGFSDRDVFGDSVGVHSGNYAGLWAVSYSLGSHALHRSHPWNPAAHSIINHFLWPAKHRDKTRSFCSGRAGTGAELRGLRGGKLP
ncbi:MAG: hypothetical protein EBS96_14535, partial [Spartobacteria bacterium]|nr:hypothetical protein [Spartobacteria bacterium]